MRQIDVSGISTIIEYDPDYGFQKSLNDPDAGLTQYVFNSLGQLVTQIDHKNVTTTLTYDKLGRLTGNSNPIDGTISYLYDSEPNGIGKLSQVLGYNSINMHFSYDAFGRLGRQSEVIDGTSFNTDYHYNQYSQVDQITYPSGFSISQSYNNGFLTTISKTTDNDLIYINETINSLGLVEQYKYGNSIRTIKAFNPNHHTLDDLIAKPVGGINPVFHYHYEHDPSTFFVSSREDVVRGKKETFEYDPVYTRLTNINGLNGLPSSNISYDNSGNIQSIDNSVYQYGSNGAGNHGVSSITNYPATEQNISYSTFNKVSSIVEGGHLLDITYGPDYSRKKSVFKENNAIVSIKYQLSNYEKVIKDGITSELHYINGNDGLAAVFVKRSDNTENMYYVHKDHLGSILELTDESGTIVTQASASFDAWGNRRDPDTWQPYSSAPPPLFLGRGFTGHEHYETFSLINMNGRCYDPKVGRFLSPDIFVQNPGYSQSYNRYSYCLNNPINFIDPTGFFDDYYCDYGDDWGPEEPPKFIISELEPDHRGWVITLNPDWEEWYEREQDKANRIDQLEFHPCFELDINMDRAEMNFVELHDYSFPTNESGYSDTEDFLDRMDFDPGYDAHEWDEVGDNLSGGGDDFYGARTRFISEDIPYNSYFCGAINTQESVYYNFKRSGLDSYEGKLLMHEFGHYLQNKYGGGLWYYLCLVPTSLININSMDSYNYDRTWTEIQANTMSYYYFNYPSFWDFNSYPINHNYISDELKSILYYHLP